MCGAWRCGSGWALAVGWGSVLVPATRLHPQRWAAMKERFLPSGAATLLRAAETAEAATESPLVGRQGQLRLEKWVYWRIQNLLFDKKYDI